MRGFFARMGERFARFMYGRYGNDNLNRFLTITSLIILVISLIPVLWFLWFLALGLMIWSSFRCYSRNIYKRRRENERYLKLIQPIKNFSRLQKNKRRDRKTHRYFKCKHCRAVLRVPKGKGKIDVTCPRCQKITVKKT
ncbi:MAG: hypothetical protein IJX19_06425 [Clostridia bacterium]|nr:hypothetical protein [Clostridia bacterium]